MTIVTKPLSDKKQDQLKKPLVVAGSELNDGNIDVEAVSDPHYVIPGRVHRVSTATLLALFLTSLLVLGVGVAGGLYMYRHYARVPSHRVQGWFQIPTQPQAFPQTFGPSENFAASLNISEQFDIDMNNDMEDIYVPDFGSGRRGRFIHDFNANKTGIVDLEGKRCFVMPLNRARVLPPRSMFDLINKIWEGYYEVDTEVVRETYRVVVPPITGIEEMGLFIYRECAGLPTYRLKRAREALFKRSLEESEEFREFAGKKITHFRIMMNGVSEYERDHPRNGDV